MAPDDREISIYPTGNVQTLSSAVRTAHGDEGWRVGDPVIEPDVVARLADGLIVFGQRCDGNDAFP